MTAPFSITPNKINVMANVLSQKSWGEVLAIAPTKSQLVLKMEKLNLDVMPSKDSELITTQVV
jgi:hypothetical protein